MKAIATMIRFVSAVVLWFAALLPPGVQATTTTYYHNDLAGSPVVATDASGSVIWRESYRPYGERLTKSAASSGNKIWFTSRRQDVETGLVYMGARYYDPVVGRFMAMDPVGFLEQNVHSHNRYVYANNNPHKFIDPDGRMAQLVARAVYFAAYEGATTLGAGRLGYALAGLLWTLNEGADSEASKAEHKPPDASSASAPDPADRGGELTKAGRAQQKHGDRAGSAFDRATGRAEDKNAQGQATVDDILNSPNRTEESNRRGGIDVRETADGRGARFNEEGKFSGFIEPRVKP